MGWVLITKKTLKKVKPENLIRLAIWLGIKTYKVNNRDLIDAINLELMFR